MTHALVPRSIDDTLSPLFNAAVVAVQDTFDQVGDPAQPLAAFCSRRCVPLQHHCTVTHHCHLKQVRLIRVRVGSEVPASSTLDGKLGGRKFAFSAGQWVDFHIPGVEKIGGYTIISAPGLPEELAVRQLCPTSDLEFDLAVKKSRHPPVRSSRQHLLCSILCVGPGIDV